MKWPLWDKLKYTVLVDRGFMTDTELVERMRARFHDMIVSADAVSMQDLARECLRQMKWAQRIGSHPHGILKPLTLAPDDWVAPE